MNTGRRSHGRRSWNPGPNLGKVDPCVSLRPPAEIAVVRRAARAARGYGVEAMPTKVPM